MKLYVFQTVHPSIIRSFSLYTQQWYMSADLYVLHCVQWKTPDDRQMNCLKHVEFHSKNKFEKLVHLVGFVIRKYIHTYTRTHLNTHTYTRTCVHIQGVTGGTDQNSGKCSLGHTIPIKPKTPISKVEWLRRYWREKFETLTAITHLLITKYILKLAGICGFCSVNICT